MCRHRTDEHSREPGIGCLQVVLSSVATDHPLCSCTRPGTSEADQ